jgi:hypothetical protein
MGGGTPAGKVSKSLKSKASDARTWAWWCHERADQERSKGNNWSAAGWDARGYAADAEAAAADAAAKAAEKAGL